MNAKKLLYLALCLANFSVLCAQDVELHIEKSRALPSYRKVLLPRDSMDLANHVPWVDVADFNRDGRLDLVVGEVKGKPLEPSFAVALYFQTEQRIFERQSATYEVPIQNRIRGIFARDFNLDGFLDLLVCDQHIDFILLRGKADGTLDVPITLGIPASNATVADVNKDSIPDVVGASDGGVAVWLGTRDGSVMRSQQLETFSSDIPNSLIGDVDGDGNLDVVVCANQDLTTTTGNLDVFLGKGDGTFEPVIRNEQVATWRGALADFNNDGKLDFAGTRGGPLAVEIQLGQGNGRFRKGRTYVTNGTDPQFVSAGDLNGDRILDLVVSHVTLEPHPARLGIRLGNGDGTFQSSIDYLPFTGYLSADILPRLVDLDGDGRPEIISHAVRSPNLDSAAISVGYAELPSATANGYLLNLRGARNATVVLESSMDLNLWTALGTNTPASDWPFIHATAVPSRFYRARYQR